MTGMAGPEHPAADLYAAEVERHILALREALVRHDENLAAWRLLDECVPIICRGRPAVREAWRDQREMVLHAIQPQAYEEYYAANLNERPFEEQYGLTVETAHRIPRFEILRQWLDRAGITRVLDLSCNDGAMAAMLALAGIQADGVDLNPGCIRRAQSRLPGRAFTVGDFTDTATVLPVTGQAPAVVLFETLEHLPDPARGLRCAARYVEKGGRLYVSTPLGAVEQGNLPDWGKVERKGHLWAWTGEEFLELLAAAGEVMEITLGPDRVMVAEVLVPARALKAVA